MTPEQQTPASVVERLTDPNFAGPMQHLRDWSELDRLHAGAAALIERLSAEREGGHKVTWVNDASNAHDRRMYVDGQQWAKVYGWDDASLNARCDALERALTRGESRQTGAREDLRVPGGYRGPSSSGPITPPRGGSSIVHPGDETDPDKWDMGRLR
jgi:hypothetical protein